VKANGFKGFSQSDLWNQSRRMMGKLGTESQTEYPQTFELISTKGLWIKINRA